MKLISLRMYFEPHTAEMTSGSIIFLSLPFRASLLIPPQIYQLNAHMYIYIITCITFLLHVSVFYTPEIRVALPEDDV